MPADLVGAAPPVNVGVQTVEHLLSALAGMGISDAIIEVDGPEIPIGDGSAAIFVSLIERAGICPTNIEMGQCPPTAVVTEPISFKAREASIEAFPSDQPGLHLTYLLDYGTDGRIPRQSASLQWIPGQGVLGYGASIAPARTFCLLEEAVAMRKMGLFSSFEPKDLLVIGPDGPVDNSYRTANEPATHKLLDLLGDLSLCGRAVQGRIVATRAGHALNHLMARAIASL